MGRFQQTIDDALAARKQQEEAKKRAEEDAKRAILPFYNKVMPILNEAKSDLDRAATEEPRIEINYQPNVDFRRDPDTEFIFFQLRPNTGAPTSVYRFSFNPQKGLFGANRHPPQGRRIETLIQDPIDKVTDDQIVEIVRSAISEAYTLRQTG